jgi:hypothetical protein
MVADMDDESVNILSITCKDFYPWKTALRNPALTHDLIPSRRLLLIWLLQKATIGSVEGCSDRRLQTLHQFQADFAGERRARSTNGSFCGATGAGGANGDGTVFEITRVARLPTSAECGRVAHNP